jgi:hypothetical protein
MINKWGLPDWHNANSYGDAGNWSMIRWQWEFARRREDIREYFDKHALHQHQERVKIQMGVLEAGSKEPWHQGRLLEPHEPDFVVTVDFEKSFVFGYMFLPNPRIAEHTVSPTRSVFLVSSSIESGDGERHKFLRGIDKRCEPGICLGSNKIGDGEVRVVFDLDQPIEAQLKSAAEALKAYQKTRHGKLLQKRRQVTSPDVV